MGKDYGVDDVVILERLSQFLCRVGNELRMRRRIPLLEKSNCLYFGFEVASPQNDRH